VIAEHRSGVPGVLIILRIPVFSVFYFFCKGGNFGQQFRDEGGKYDPPYLFIKVFQNLGNSAKSINKHVELCQKNCGNYFFFSKNRRGKYWTEPFSPENK